MHFVQWMCGGVIAFGLTVIAIKGLMPLAWRWGLLDIPAGRKNHEQPMPVTGGVAMLLAIVASSLLLSGVPDRGVLGFVLAAAVLIVMGVWDDKRDLSWRLRLAMQVFAALLMVLVGDVRIENLGSMFGVSIGSMGVFSVPFTVFATVGAINAINMVDGADGLAGLLVLCSLVMLEVAAVYAGNLLVAGQVPILIGAVAGFLAFNVRLPWQRRAKIFMGNAGSAFLGLAVAWSVCLLTQNPAHPVDPVLALWLVPIPIIDCLRLMLRRVRNRRSPFAADREHIHHLMLESGFGHTGMALALAAFSMLCGLAASLYLRSGLPHVILFAAFVALGLVWYWFTASRQRATKLFRALLLQPAARFEQPEYQAGD